MGEQTGLLGRSSRLLKSQDYARLSRHGKRSASPEFVLLMATESGSLVRRTIEPRLGLSTSRAVGNAVVRNRIRRQVREWFREKRHAFPNSMDLVVIARKQAAHRPSRDLRRSLDQLVERNLQMQRFASGTTS